jgi:uncharacterized protein YjiK
VSSKLPDPLKNPPPVTPMDPAAPAAASSPAPEPTLSKAEKKAHKKQKKAEKRQREAHRSIDSWERYRALNDAFDMQQELVDLADHKARFALIIMGALNAVFFLLGINQNVQSHLPATAQPWIIGYLALYACVAVTFFLQAIESLRPREGRPYVPDPGSEGYEDHPLGVRFFEDVLRRDIASYQAAWREIRIGQLNAELAVQVHVLARINHAKYAALRRLYSGLRIMTLLLAGLLVTIAVAMLPALYPGGAASSGFSLGKGKKARAAAALGLPVKLQDTGVREPSGIVYHARLGHFFVVGDEGTLAELDETGKLLRTDSVKGNLEDVTVHTPSGRLVLISEKSSTLILFDPVKHEELRRWHVKPSELLGESRLDKNHGFEGLAFKEEAGRSGGGVFYLVNQKTPEMVVAIAFSLDAPTGDLHPEIVGRWPIAEKNVKAAMYVPSLDRLLVLSDKRGVIVLAADGHVEHELALPAGQTEGMCLDDAGNLWIADDHGKSLWRFDGALAVLRAAIDGKSG